MGEVANRFAMESNISVGGGKPVSESFDGDQIYRDLSGKVSNEPLGRR
jgi:hypothetical protein